MLHGEDVWGGNLGCKGTIAQGLLCLKSLSRGTQLELFHITVPLSKFTWCVGDSALGNLGSSLREEEVPESESVCVRN